MPEQGNLLTLWDEAVPPERIPAVPGMGLRTAKAGDVTYRIKTEHRISKYRWAVDVEAVEATEGEPLRGPDMQLLPDFMENLRFRARVLKAAEDNPRLQELQRILCRSSILYYVSTFGWTYDPRRAPGERHIPFVPFPFQADILTWMVWTTHMQQDGLIEKSRSVGMTWMFVLFIDWLSTFYPGQTSYLTSLREEDVDNRTPDSLFGKIRYQHSRLPDWLQAGWKQGDHEVDKLLNLHFPDTGAYIRGQKVESTGGRQGRASVLGADEFAHVGSGVEALEAFTELAASKFFFSTPKGMAGAFAQMAHEPGANKKHLHWSMHPLKDEDWAKRESSKTQYFDDSVWAQEQEVDYAGSVSARVFPQFAWAVGPGIEWVHVRRDEVVQYDPLRPVIAMIDLGTNDPCAVLFAQRKPIPPEYHHMTPLRETLAFIAEYEGRDMTAYCLRYLLNQQPYRYEVIVVDGRTGDAKESSGSTWITNLADPDVIAHQSIHFGEIIQVGPPVRVVGVRPYEEPAFDIVRTLLGQVGGMAINELTCPHFVQVLQNWSYPINKDTRRKIAGAPANHDQWSHKGKAMCYGIYHLHTHVAQSSGASIPDDWDFSTRQARFR
jgi:hypothetical protein